MVPFAAVMSAGIYTNAVPGTTATWGTSMTIDGITNARRTLIMLADGVGAVAVGELEDWALTKTGRNRAVNVIENFMVRE
jgi:hypothetical protein